MFLVFTFLLVDLQDTADFEWMMWFSTFREHILFALSGHVLFAKICSMLAPQVLLLTDALISWLSCCRKRKVKDVKDSGLTIWAQHWATLKRGGRNPLTLTVSCFHECLVTFGILFVTLYFYNTVQRLFISLAKQQLMNGTRWKGERRRQRESEGGMAADEEWKREQIEMSLYI